MQPAAVVVPFDKFLQPALQVLEITVGGRVDLFTLERFEKAFARSIVIRIARSAHTGKHPVLPQRFHVFLTCVLYPLIGMVHDSVRRPPISNRSLQRTHCKLRLEALPKRPANDLAREGIEDHREEYVFASETDVGYVSDPELF